jgi:transcriptional regulator with XRE-family HTH domain
MPRAREQVQRMAAELRVARAAIGLTREQVAAKAGLAPSTIQRIEAGYVDTGIATLAAAMAAVGLDLVLTAYPGRTIRLRDSGQMTIAEQLRGIAAPYWTARLEVSAGDHGQSADVVFFGADEILHVEIERRAVDFQGQYRSALRKREYLATRADRPVRLVLVITDSRHNRDALVLHEALIRSQLPAHSRAVLRALKLGRPLGTDGLAWLRPHRVQR